MLKLVLVGVWVAMVTAASVYVSANLLNGHATGGKEAAAEDLGVEELKTEMTSVPMIRGGEILGYVVIQLSFAADRALLQALKVEPQPFLIDAAFRTVFASPQVDFRRIRSGDLDMLTKEIARQANVRLGQELVREVLIQQLNYVKREDIRTNWIGKPSSDH